MTNDDTARFLDRDIVFANGSRGANLQISSASPVNFFQVLNHADSMVRTTIDGKLFLPPDAEPSPTKRFCCVIVVPGSLGVAPSHLMHAQTLTGLGIAAFVHPITGIADPDLVDRDLMIYSIKAGYGVRGALIGSNPGEADAFREDMSSFWRTAMQR